MTHNLYYTVYLMPYFNVALILINLSYYLCIYMYTFIYLFKYSGQCNLYLGMHIHSRQVIIEAF